MKHPLIKKLFPLNLTAFICFSIIGLALPVLPLYVHHDLGLSEVIVGIVVGAQFAAALLTRAWAGALTDAKGGKYSVFMGIGFAVASAVMYLVSFLLPAVASVLVLIIGRFLLGSAASLIVTGLLGWGIGLAGAQHAGKVMGWNGIAVYGAYATGAPIGVFLYERYGFLSIALISLLIPLAGYYIVKNVQPVRQNATTAAPRTPFLSVLKLIWVPGLGLSLANVGFGALTAYTALLFSARGWGNASLAFTFFGISYIGSRLCFGHLPDKAGGATVALLCVIIEAIGQFCIWGTSTPAIAYFGFTLTAIGYSLVYPAFGVEVIKFVPPQSRGTALGAFSAFMDVSLFITIPFIGYFIGIFGTGVAYLISGIAAVLAAFSALWLRNHRA